MELNLFVLVFVGCLAGNVKVAAVPGPMEKLMHVLLVDYNKIVTPENGDGKPLNVSHSVNLLKLDSLKDQVLTLNTWITMQWKDSRLTWDPKQFDNIEKVRIPSKLLWIPDIVLFNSAEELKGSFGSDLNAVVEYNGDITYVPPVKTRSYCELKAKSLKRHHKVTCKLRFGSWTYEQGLMDMFNPLGNFVLDDYTPNQIWKLGSSSAVREVRKYDCCEEEYTTVTYTLSLKYKDG